MLIKCVLHRRKLHHDKDEAVAKFTINVDLNTVESKYCVPITNLMRAIFDPSFEWWNGYTYHISEWKGE